MKLINPTFKKYPAQTADAIYGRKLSHAFQEILGNDFLLIVVKNEGDELSGVNTQVFSLHKKRFRFFQYVGKLFFLVIQNRKSQKELVFFSNDYTLICVLIFLRKVCFFSYHICVDWHMLSESWKDAYMAKHADLHITTTQQLKNLILEKNEKIDPCIYVAYGGVDEHLFSHHIQDKKTLRQKLNLPLDTKLIGYVGFFKTLGMEKGIGTMIASLKYLDDTSQMVFVGGKDDEIHFYRKRAEEEGVLGRCIFLEVMPHEKIIQYEQALDALVIPYPKQPHFEKYGFPMKTYEYMLSGNPIIYSNLPILSEVLGNFAFSFEADNGEDLARVIRYVDNNQKEREENIILAKRMALELTWNRKAKSIISFIKHKLQLD